MKFKDELWFDDTLVYEENEIGLFRCTFHRNHQDGPLFEFKYWEYKLIKLGLMDKANQTLTRDPMRRYIFEIYKMLRPVRVTNYNVEDLNLEALAEVGEL